MSHLLLAAAALLSPIRSLLNVPCKLSGRARRAQFSCYRSLASGLIGPSSNDDYYARQLDFPADLQVFTTPGVMRKFFSSGVLFDRDDIINSISNELSNQGTFTLLLGGKSVGKSLILLTLAEEYNEAGGKAVVVNMRLTGSKGLTASLVESIEELDPAFKRDVWELLRKGTALEDKERAQSILRLFTALTKETRTLNVLLASSEYVYPYRLREELEFKVANIGKTVFASEVPPACMREFLVEKWGLGPGLHWEKGTGNFCKKLLNKLPAGNCCEKSVLFLVASCFAKCCER
ncbi:hypothetical protein B484DRAFT_465973, partial [Ochromonadaceae sp. CCMP2298]